MGIEKHESCGIPLADPQHNAFHKSRTQSASAQ